MTEYREVHEELSARGFDPTTDLGQKVHKSVEEILIVLDSQENMSEEERKIVLDHIYHISTKSLKVGPRINSPSRWKEFKLGDAPITSVVRVRPLEFSSDPGIKFNGLVGRIIGVHGGRVLVKFIGRRNGTSTYFSPKNLELLLLLEEE